MLPRFGDTNHANGHNDRSRHCEVDISGARHRRRRRAAASWRALRSYRRQPQECAVNVAGWNLVASSGSYVWALASAAVPQL
jgi:hypothetical protein